MANNMNFAITVDDGSRRVLAVVNKSPDKPVALDVSALIPGGPRAVAATVLDGDSPDAYNDIGAETRVVPRPAALGVANGKVTLAPHSFSIIKL